MKNEIAYDAYENIIFVGEAKKGKDYFCPSCHEKLVFKNSGKTGPGSRCAHFSHIGGSDCNESSLHAIFKHETVKILRGCLNEEKPFFVELACRDCGVVHKLNLISGIISVEEELSLGTNCPRPDVALINENKEVVAVMEIVVEHEPEEKALTYYKKNKILIFKYYPQEHDLNDMISRLQVPVFNYHCYDCNVRAYRDSYRDYSRLRPPRRNWILERGKLKRKHRL